MTVYDRDGATIGTVKVVYLGAESDITERGQTPATASERPGRGSGLLDELMRAFGASRVPSELRQRLLHDGFIRIDTRGLFAADRYAMAGDVAAVEPEAVRLRVGRDDLLAA